MPTAMRMPHACYRSTSQKRFYFKTIITQRVPDNISFNLLMFSYHFGFAREINHTAYSGNKVASSIYIIKYFYSENVGSENVCNRFSWRITQNMCQLQKSRSTKCQESCCYFSDAADVSSKPTNQQQLLQDSIINYSAPCD